MPRIYPEHKQRFEDEKKQIRQFLKTRIKGATVSQGKGGSSAWLVIKAPGRLNVAQANGLMAMGVIARPGDKSVNVSPMERQKFINKINMVSGPPRLSDRISKTGKKPSLGKKRVNVYAKAEAADNQPYTGSDGETTFRGVKGKRYEVRDLKQGERLDSGGRIITAATPSKGFKHNVGAGEIVTTPKPDRKQFGFGGKRKNRFN
tara:strand:- start:6 stop:617 length:612 start_codon:yes stop_codon:yes gene_type:complete